MPLPGELDSWGGTERSELNIKIQEQKKKKKKKHRRNPSTDKLLIRLKISDCMLKKETRYKKNYRQT